MISKSMKIIKQLSLLQEEGVLLVSIDETKNRFRVYYIYLGANSQGQPYIFKKWGRVCVFKGGLALRGDRWLSEEIKLYLDLETASASFQSTLDQKLSKGYREININYLHYSVYTQLSLLEYLEKIKLEYSMRDSRCNENIEQLELI